MINLLRRLLRRSKDMINKDIINYEQLIKRNGNSIEWGYETEECKECFGTGVFTDNIQDKGVTMRCPMCNGTGVRKLVTLK